MPSVPKCESCGIPFVDHAGLQKTCKALQESLAMARPTDLDSYANERTEELLQKLDQLRVSCQLFAECLLSVRKHNTDEWMDYAAGSFNDLCDALGTGDRFQFDGRDRLRRVK